MEATLPARVEARVRQVGTQVRDVRDVVVVELLYIAEPDHPASHPVGQANQVCADVLAEGELVFDFAVISVVVVDRDVVIDRDSGLVLKAHQGGVVAVVILVDVCGPVRPVQGLVIGRVVWRSRRCGLPVTGTRGQSEGSCASAGSRENCAAG